MGCIILTFVIVIINGLFRKLEVMSKMCDHLIIYILALVCYCKCQFPINARFTDGFNLNRIRPRVLMEATNSRILNQFQVRPSTVGGQSRRMNVNVNLHGNINTGSNVTLLPDRNTNKELERFGMGNAQFAGRSNFGNNNSVMSSITGGALGNVGIRNPTQRQSNFDWNNSVQRVTSNLLDNRHTRARQPITTQQQHRIIRPDIGTAENRNHNFINSINISSLAGNTQDIIPVRPSTLLQRTSTENVRSLPIQPTNIDTGISEAALLQMGNNELAELGNHGISLNSIVDATFNPVDKHWISNSSTEEKLIIALLERLLEMKVIRRQKEQKEAHFLPQVVGISNLDKQDRFGNRHNAGVNIQSEQRPFHKASTNTEATSTVLEQGSVVNMKSERKSFDSVSTKAQTTNTVRDQGRAMGMRSERRPFGSVSTNTDRAGTMTDQGRVMDLRSERRPLKSVSTNTQTVDTNLDQEKRVNVRSERKSFDSISTKTKKTDTLVDQRKMTNSRSERRPFDSRSTNSQTSGTAMDQGRAMNQRSERRPFDSVPVNTQTAGTMMDQGMMMNPRSERRSFASVPGNSQTAGTMVDQGRMVNPRRERRPLDSGPVNTQTAGTMVDQGRMVNPRSEQRPFASVPVNSQTAGTMVDQGRMVNPRSERRPFDSVPVNTQTADTTVEQGSNNLQNVHANVQVSSIPCQFRLVR
jgi:hypothetical protein